MPKKITELAPAASVDLGDVLPMDTGSETRKATFDQVKSAVLSGGTERQVLQIASSVPTWRYKNIITFNEYDETDDTANADTTRDLSLCDASGGAFTLNIPFASIETGRVHTFKKTDSTLNAVTLEGDSFSTTLNTQGEAVDLYFNGTDWALLRRDIPQIWVDAGEMVITATSNPTKGTRTKDKVTWYRQGKYARIRWEYKQTGTGSAGSGTYFYTLPSSLVMDSARFSTSDPNRGTPTIGFGSNNNHYISVQAASTTTIFLCTQTTVGGSPVITNMGSSYGALSLSAIDQSWEIFVPISGWNGV